MTHIISCPEPLWPIRKTSGNLILSYLLLVLLLRVYIKRILHVKQLLNIFILNHHASNQPSQSLLGHKNSHQHAYRI